MLRKAGNAIDAIDPEHLTDADAIRLLEVSTAIERAIYGIGQPPAKVRRVTITPTCALIVDLETSED
jgi:hypothetical protein